MECLGWNKTEIQKRSQEADSVLWFCHHCLEKFGDDLHIGADVAAQAVQQSPLPPGIVNLLNSTPVNFLSSIKVTKTELNHYKQNINDVIQGRRSVEALPVTPLDHRNDLGNRQPPSQRTVDTALLANAKQLLHLVLAAILVRSTDDTTNQITVHTLEKKLEDIRRNTSGEFSTLPQKSQTLSAKVIRNVLQLKTCNCALHQPGAPVLVERSSPSKSADAKTKKGAINDATILGVRFATPAEFRQNIDPESEESDEEVKVELLQLQRLGTCPDEGDSDHSKDCANYHLLSSNENFHKAASQLEDSDSLLSTLCTHLPQLLNYFFFISGQRNDQLDSAFVAEFIADGFNTAAAKPLLHPSTVAKLLSATPSINRHLCPRDNKYWGIRTTDRTATQTKTQFEFTWMKCIYWAPPAH